MAVTADIRDLDAGAAEASKLLNALANERRLLIPCQIAGREMSVDEIQDMRRESQTIYCRLASPEAQRIIETLADI